MRCQSNNAIMRSPFVAAISHYPPRVTHASAVRRITTFDTNGCTRHCADDSPEGEQPPTPLLPTPTPAGSLSCSGRLQPPAAAAARHGATIRSVAHGSGGRQTARGCRGRPCPPRPPNPRAARTRLSPSVPEFCPLPYGFEDASFCRKLAAARATQAYPDARGSASPSPSLSLALSPIRAPRERHARPFESESWSGGRGGGLTTPTLARR
jgi:hypothetical protein